jgi:hypothetical protein
VRRPLSSLVCTVLVLNPGGLRAEGLISRLPADGARVKYDLHSTTEMQADGADLPGLATPRTVNVRGAVTLSSVGQTKVDVQEYRWIEIGREIPEQEVKSVLKLLIPERYLRRGEDPFSHVLRMDNWNRGGIVKEPEHIVDEPRKRYELERYRSYFPERLRDERSLGKQVIRTPLGPIDCEGRVGTAELKPSPLFPETGGEWAWKGEIEIWENDKYAFGVVSLLNRTTGYETVGNTGKKIQFKSVTKLVISAVGNDAVTAMSGPSPLPVLEVEKASVEGKVTDPDGNALAGVRVLFGVPKSNEVLASVTTTDGTYQCKTPVGTITVHITHRTVGPDGKAKAVILLKKTVEVPAEGGTFDFITENGIPE